VLRTALRPKWLALLALALALASAFAWLGTWQLDRSRSEATESELRDQAAADPVPLTEVLAPQQALTGEAGRATVLVEGDLDAAEARVSPRRELDGRTGSWVVVPVRVDGARLPVVLGWQAGDDLPALADGEVRLSGTLRSPEAPSGTSAEGAVLETVSTADLVNLWGSPLYSAYLVASAEDAAAAGLEPVPGPDRSGAGFALQNLSYALQWWVFAAFAVFLWWRVVRDDHLDRTALREVADHEQAPAPARGPDPDPDHDPDQQDDHHPVRSTTP
jgi:cytochrome oxidase assembly protein ShyY1